MKNLTQGKPIKVIPLIVSILRNPILRKVRV